MSIEKNKSMAREFIETMAAGHFSALSDDCIFWIAGNSIFSGPKSKRQMIEAFAAVKDMVEGEFIIRPTSLTAEEDRVSVEAESKVRFKDGRIYNNKYHMLFFFKDEKIVHVREYNDTALVNKTFGVASE